MIDNIEAERGSFDKAPERYTRMSYCRATYGVGVMIGRVRMQNMGEKDVENRGSIDYEGHPL